ncbi:hypothetical protein K432DRAFT_334944 [Lepidopterella palustris CBS 459.81]|uniref:Zn(2)-C6 fungal-type domain-containing protein n=1 Tax=Lepidopterella palustris CBS 459.81 TaxID=1314670 RepID=A0A8E2E471_9PEZI|nr:hypothetical protein K432DRAFT_334944 [Lepidopterella palustris CBS 459.81]
MQSSDRKRVGLACIPCYRKKQKCNRRYPCNQCTKRRQPEECIYYTSQASHQTPRTENRLHEDVHVEPPQEVTCSAEVVVASADWGKKKDQTLSRGSDSLAELFAYVEHSESNTLALILKMGLSEDDDDPVGNRPIPQELYGEIEKNIKQLPSREIFDFLVQYYVTEVHWMEQVVYAPWFVGQYQKWWISGRPSRVLDIEFAVLFLRICSYASQFLPSPSFTIDRIRGMPLTEIRDACHEIAGGLAAICRQLDMRGSVIRVQHLSTMGLQRQCEGRINAFWEALSDAVRVAQRIGLPRGRAAWKQGMHEFDKEIRCRVFCNLYIWDSLLSRQLDCDPFLPTTLTPEHLPRMHVEPHVNEADVPECFTERLILARLVKFWRSFPSRPGAEYEATEAEERYDKFCREFLAQLPPVFALDFSKEWDERLERLPLQRQTLHIAIFDFLCHNFRPVLLCEPSQVQSLPAYKQVLVASQRKALAAATLKTLEGVSKLHSMLGGSHTRRTAIILPTFEAAVVLVGLIMDVNFPGASMGEDGLPRALDVDPLGWEKAQLTRDRCYRAAQEGLARLQMLAEVSDMARAGANTLARLIAKIPSGHIPQWHALQTRESNLSPFDDFLENLSAGVFPVLEGEPR